MKGKFILLVLAVSQYLFSHAQVTRESYEKAVDLLNCRSVELSLKTDTRWLTEFKRKCPCGGTNFGQIKNFLDSANKLDATVALSLQIEQLKQKFRDNWKKEDAIAFLSEEIYKDKTGLPRIYAFADKRKSNPDFDSFKAEMNTDLQNNLVEGTSNRESTITKVEDIKPNNQGDKLQKPEGSDATTKDGKGFLDSYSGLIAILATLLGLSALTVALSRPSTERIYNLMTEKLIRSTRMNEHFQQKNSIFKSTSAKNQDTSHIERRVSELAAELRSLHDMVQRFQAILTQHGKQPEPEAGQAPRVTQPHFNEPTKTEVHVETFFHASPNSDGSFDENYASPTYREGATIYQFTKSGNGKATFKIAERESSIKLALQYRDKRIDPACEAVNAFNQAKSVITLEEGKAELKNGRWEIVKKARVRYEN